jgi:hypothetical protein
MVTNDFMFDQDGDRNSSYTPQTRWEILTLSDVIQDGDDNDQTTIQTGNDNDAHANASNQGGFGTLPLF